MFGLFKKDQTADTVFVNGHIYTQDADMPWAEAVACKDGEIVYVGNSEDAENFQGTDTYMVDLNGKYMFPGFISTHSHPPIFAFKDMYIPIPTGYGVEDILGMMSDYVFNNPEEEVYFAYGSDSDLLQDFTREEASAKLDEICSDKPMLILSKEENTLWVNTIALEEAQAAAQSEGKMQITIQYFLQAVIPFDYEELKNRTGKLVCDYCEKGFTSIFDAGSPQFMDDIYQDTIVEMCQQNMIKQRNFGSLRVMGHVHNPDNVVKRLMQKKTKSTELDDYVHCNALKLVISGEASADSLGTDMLVELLKKVSERGFDIHIDATDPTALSECLEAVTELRNAGFRKNNIIIACEEELRKSQETLLEDVCLDNVFFQEPTVYEDTDEYAALAGATAIEEIIDRFTIDAAIALGMNNKLGSVEKGKFADFTVFEENPFDLITPAMFKKLSADMTVVAGQVVYDAEEDNMQEWYDLMSGMQV